MAIRSRRKVAVIGSGFYGLAIGTFLARKGFEVAIFEALGRPGLGASWVNQARVHGGYHYPRNQVTGMRSRISQSRFVADYGSAVFSDFQSIYAIASIGSKVTSGQFEAYCQRIEAPFDRVPLNYGDLDWNPRLIDSVYLVDEPAFDVERLVEVSLDKFLAAGGVLNLNSTVDWVEELPNGYQLSSSDKKELYDAVFDVTYSKLGRLFEPASSMRRKIKLERSEIAFFKPPRRLAKVGITVMDGPFFSFMPFPTNRMHTLTHVTYTPREIQDDILSESSVEDVSNWKKMIRDATRLLPCIEESQYHSSVFTDKAVLHDSEDTDGRPIVIRKSGCKALYFSVLGAKIDNIYDALTSIGADKELLELQK
jgi:glycine/D-amino acid oxidase-like deaminating enzyme